MIFGTLGVLLSFNSFAEEEEEESEVLDAPTIAGFSLSQKHGSAQSKIDNDEYMTLSAAVGDYQIYANSYTGEVYFKNAKTNQILTTNPYDTYNYNVYSDSSAPKPVASTNLPMLMSQLVVRFTDIEGQLSTFTSYAEAAERGQIRIKNIKNGIRVEYTMGRLNSMYLVPVLVAADDWDTYLWNPMNDSVDSIGRPANAVRQLNKFKIWYAEKTAEKNKDEFECLKNGSLDKIYSLDVDGMSDGRYMMLEGIVKAYAPDFTYDILMKIHDRTGYVAETKETPLFRISIEYTIDAEDGSLNISVPGNSIRYNSSLYTIESVSLLPFLGAINADNEGYLFYPDGSGSLITFENLINNSLSIQNPVYGDNFAYYTLTGQHQAQISMPVYGMMQTTAWYTYKPDPKFTLSERTFQYTQWSMTPEGDWNYGTDIVYTPTDFERSENTYGFVAIIEEGESLMNIVAQSGASSYSYASAYTTFNPRPKDTYDLADSVSVSGNTEWTVTSENKYAGNFKIKVFMLAETEEFQPSWQGMAKAYNNYLVDNEIIDPLTMLEVSENIPIYIESFGSIVTTTKFLSVPVTTNMPLTTFENVSQMHGELYDKGVKNINFKLTGFYNGGLSGDYPSKLKWTGSVGGEKDFLELLENSENNEKARFGVFVDFDFSYTRAGKGIGIKENAAKTVDGKYSNKQIYSPVYQEYVSFFDVCIKTSSIAKFVDDILGTYSEYNRYSDTLGISVGTLGSDLNSNFDEDDDTDREESKTQMIEVLQSLNSAYPDSLMTSVGNAYALKYASHILNLSLDSGHISAATYTVPFTGMVLHGYVNYTGSAINEAGDADYELLKAIENGASLYYLLSYANTSYMKEDPDLNVYFSIRYDIWKDQLVEHYNTVNTALKDLQLYKISDHAFISAERIPDDVDVKNTSEKFFDEVLVALKETIKTKYEKMNEQAKADYDAGLIPEGQIITISTDNQKIYDKALALITANMNDEEKAIAGLANGLSKEMKNQIDKVIADCKASIPGKDGATVYADVLIDDIEADLNYNITDSEATDKNYVKTDYTIDDGSVVLVTYSNGRSEEDVKFVINYNLCDIDVRIDGVVYTVESYGFVRI